MKLTKSKQALADAIHASGKGWPDGANWACQHKTQRVVFTRSTAKPKLCAERTGWTVEGDYFFKGFTHDKLLPNWHQTILSREEYFFLHQNQGLEDALDEPMVEAKPTIEQLAADYRNLLDFALRKQQEADDAKSDADEAMRKMELAGEDIGLVVTPITAKQEPEPVIAVQVGDEVECVESNIKRDKYNGMAGRLRTIDESYTSTPYLVDFGGGAKIWCHEVKFIRRP